MPSLDHARSGPLFGLKAAKTFPFIRHDEILSMHCIFNCPDIFKRIPFNSEASSEGMTLKVNDATLPCSGGALRRVRERCAFPNVFCRS